MKTLKVIAINGKAGAGKDSLANHFIEMYGYKRKRFAGLLKEIVKLVFKISDEDIEDRSKRDDPISYFPDWTIRKLLQVIGTEGFRDNIDEDIWVKTLLLDMENDGHDKFVIPDLRFPNELTFLEERVDLLSIKVIRESYEGNVGISNHQSESHNLLCDYTFDNNGTLDELYELADRKLGLL